MKTTEITEELGLQRHHFKLQALDIPIIDSHLYTTLGRRLYEQYQKYGVASQDQREMERLTFLLISFTLTREQKSKNLWGWLKGVIFGTQ